ncbi:MAG: sulfotransferase [Stagnimonas sp.]|nr:sulfotransferase [Stagnimonas sp.]
MTKLRPASGLDQQWQQEFLIIAGVPKAGTTSLFDYLASHPQICPCRSKEPGFFLPADAPFFSKVRAARGDSFQSYQALFDAPGERVCMDGSVVYLHSPGSAEGIHTALPRARICVVLREPIARLKSFYQMGRFKRDFPPEMSLADFVDEQLRMAADPQASERPWGLVHSTYSACLAHYFNVFGRDRVHLVWFDELRENPEQVLRALCGFCGIDDGFFKDFKPYVLNESRDLRSAGLIRGYDGLLRLARAMASRLPVGREGLRRAYRRLNPWVKRTVLTRPAEHATLDAGRVAALQNYFAADTAELERLLGRRPPWAKPTA